MLNQTLLDSIRLGALNSFDAVDHIGFSDDTSLDLASSDTLTGEFIRKTATSTKTPLSFKNEFESILTLTDANGETINKIGLFTDLAGNTLQLNVLTSSVAKTAVKEITLSYEITTEVEDLT